MAYSRSGRKSARRPAYRGARRVAAKRAPRARRSGAARAASTLRIVIEQPSAAGPSVAGLGPFEKIVKTRRAQF